MSRRCPYRMRATRLRQPATSAPRVVLRAKCDATGWRIGVVAAFSNGARALESQAKVVFQASFLGLRQHITEDEPRPPNDLTHLDPDRAGEDWPLEHQGV